MLDPVNANAGVDEDLVVDVKWLNWATRGNGSVVAMPSLVFPLFTTKTHSELEARDGSN